jgi:hypothetical protein
MRHGYGIADTNIFGDSVLKSFVKYIVILKPRRACSLGRQLNLALGNGRAGDGNSSFGNDHEFLAC